MFSSSGLTRGQLTSDDCSSGRRSPLAGRVGLAFSPPASSSQGKTQRGEHSCTWFRNHCHVESDRDEPPCRIDAEPGHGRQSNRGTAIRTAAQAPARVVYQSFGPLPHVAGHRERHQWVVRSDSQESTLFARVLGTPPALYARQPGEAAATLCGRGRGDRSVGTDARTSIESVCSPIVSARRETRGTILVSPNNTASSR